MCSQYPREIYHISIFLHRHHNHKHHHRYSQYIHHPRCSYHTYPTASMLYEKNTLPLIPYTSLMDSNLSIWIWVVEVRMYVCVIYKRKHGIICYLHVSFNMIFVFFSFISFPRKNMPTLPPYWINCSIHTSIDVLIRIIDSLTFNKSKIGDNNWYFCMEEGR